MDSLDVSASQTTPGHRESTHRAGAGNTNTANDTGQHAPAPDPPDVPDATAVDCESPVIPCTLNPTPAPETDEPGTVRSIPTVTLSDLASFRPDTPQLVSEPDQVGIVGLPTNLVAATGTQTLHGTLLGFHVAVRFTPHHYTFTPGDGTHTTTRTPGESWQTTGDPQFTPTATSHAYEHRGRYTASVTVAYTPAVNFGDGTWRPVPGYITATSPTQTIHIYQAHTALVAHTCTEDPHGQGC
ncbi:hypothetical protein PU630_12605 [Microbacterium horticulturae]|uniref:PKD domain-containing protein n=1 Tax=Microbacterium horticulturae TaxID=3028316 RepID=A0ABY8BVZ8_9MICO|nr:hypothetical protein [Microbacterium sp. KACC 23027]WEG08075.1 hypothetical protein PU630_12605 [Microbacterium sp. KACC 23027]